jgi:hypothetical protein
MNAKLALASCAGIAIGVGATWLVRPGAAPASVPPATAELARLSDRPPIVVAGGARTDEIRQLVAEEVRAALREQAASATPAAPAAPAAPATTPEPTPAFAHAKDHMAERIAQGAWTAADRDWLHGVIAQVNVAERDQLIRQLVVAANTGKIRVQVDGPTF